MAKQMFFDELDVTVVKYRTIKSPVKTVR